MGSDFVIYDQHNMNLNKIARFVVCIYKRHEISEACSTERALASVPQNSLYMQHKLWRAHASARSVEHASGIY